MLHLSCITFVLFSVVSSAYGNFPCLCCYTAEAIVYQAASDNSPQIGSLDEFDCKPVYPLQSGQPSDYFTIQYNKQVGYLLITPDLAIESCPGSVPLTDQVSAQNATTTTSTPIPTTTTPLPTTTTCGPTSCQTETPQPTTTPPPTTTTMVPTTPPATDTHPPTTPTTAVPTTTPVPTITPVVTTTSTSALPTTHIDCPSQWVKHGSSCYLFRMAHRNDYTHASHFCENSQAHLVFINDQQEQDYLSAHIKQMGNYQKAVQHSHDKLHDLSIWIGGVYEHHTWNWVDPVANTKSNLDFTNWWMHHYHNSDMKVCAAMNGDHHFQWRDFRCQDHFFSVCEKEI